MTIYNGSIELNTAGDCKVPQALYHTKQFATATSIPNYGTNQNIPKIYNDFNGSAGTGTQGLTSFPGPNIPTSLFVGGCSTSQFIIGFRGAPGFFGASHTDLGNVPPGSPSTGWEIQCGPATSGGYFFARLIIYQFPGTGPATYFSENYAEWFGIPASESDRNTLLITINPNTNLGGDGPGIGPPFTNGMYPSPGNWPILLNGKSPTAYGYYGSYAGQGTSCGSWINSVTAGFYVYSSTFTSSSTMLGFAAFRGQSMFTRDDFDCWHLNHDWFSDPQY